MPKKTALTAMILAAGEGTRLRPHTLTAPKPMLPVAGRPTLEWIILWLRHYGIREIVINLCHQPEPVIRYFGDGRSLDVHLTFSVEPVILGTAGGVKRVERLFTETFVVVYGDVLTDMDLGALVAFHHACGDAPHVTLSLNHAPNPWDCGIVAVDEEHRVTRFVEKPPRDDVFSDLTNAGVLVIDPPILEHVPAQGFSDISRDLLPALLRAEVPIFAQPLAPDAYLIDMGTPEKYEQAQREWPTAAAAEIAVHQVRNDVKTAVFLDRDGVIIKNRPDHVKTWSEVRFLDGVFDALAQLAALPLAVVVVSNQGVVGRGVLTLEQAWELQSKIVEAVKSHGGRIDASYLCPHHPDAGCPCRKPAPGMLQQAARELGLDLQRCWLVGDAVSDLGAAAAAGARGILVRTGRGREQEQASLSGWNDRCAVVDDLSAAVRLIAEAEFPELARSSS